MRGRCYIPILLVACGTAAMGGQESIRVRLVSGAPVVDEVYVNGRGPYSFVLDTGAEMSTISADLARELGLKTVFRVRTVTQTHEVLRDGFRAEQVRIRGVDASNEEFVVASFAAVHKMDRAIQGALGQSFLSKLDYLIDFQHKTLTFGSATVRGGVKTIFELAHGCMLTSTSHGQLTLDSGASTLVLYDASDVRWKGEVAMNTIEGQIKVRFGALKRLDVAGQEFRNVYTSAAARQRLDETESDGLLPASLFRSVYVSNSGGYVVFNAEQ